MAYSNYQQLENELHTNQSRMASMTEEKNRLEDQLSSVEAAHLLSQDQANQLQVHRTWFYLIYPSISTSHDLPLVLFYM